LSVEHVINDLQTYGLTEDEARIFVSLTILGPSKASVLAKKLGINRMKAYRTLKRLQNLGLVDAILKRPTEFVAISIEEALDILTETVKKKIQEMELKKTRIIENYRKISVTQRDEEPKFRILYGRRSIYSFLAKMFERAEEEINLAITRNGLYRFMFAGLDEVLKRCSKRGIKIKILTEINGQGIEAVKTFSDFADIRHKQSLGKTRFIIVDSKETMTTVVMDDSTTLNTERDIGLWTDSKDYTTTIKRFFHENWGEATIAKLIIEAIETGKPIEEIRIVNVEEYLKLYGRMITSPKSELLILTNGLAKFSMPTINSNITEELKARGVLIKILTPVTTKNWQKVEWLSQHFQIRHLETFRNMQFLIVDRHETLISFTYKSQRRHIWSNIKTYADVMANVFEELWTKGVEATTRLKEIKTLLTFKETLKELEKLLEKEKYYIKTPARIKGKSGIVHKFDVLIESLETPKKIFVADILTQENRMLPALMALFTKSLDTKPTSSFLITPRHTSQKEKELAKTYGIEILEGKESEKLRRKILMKILSS